MKTYFRLAGVVFGAAILAACGGAGGGTAGSPSPGQSGSPTASAPSSPAASPTLPSGFVCSDASGGSQSDGSHVTAVRVGAHPDLGYDRFVIEFDGTIPAYTVTRQNSSKFTQSPRGDQISLAGDHGVLVTVQHVQDWTSYVGPTDFGVTGQYLRQSKLIQNYEAVQQWGLGVQGAPCLNVSTMTSPSRLVIDIATQ